MDAKEKELTDKVEELKEALRECVSALSFAMVGSCSCEVKTPQAKYHNDSCGYKKYYNALTKASTLLQ